MSEQQDLKLIDDLIAWAIKRGRAIEFHGREDVPVYTHSLSRAREALIARLASPAVSTEGGRSDSERERELRMWRDLANQLEESQEADERRMDWLQRQVYDSERTEIGDVTIYGTWGGASVQIGNGPDRGLGETVREAIDAAMQASVPNASEQSPPASPSEEGR